MPRSILRLLWLGLIVSRSFGQQAETPARGWIHVNGYTYHMVAHDANSELYGIGLTWYTHVTERYQTAWEADVFSDSAKKPSMYVGYSLAAPFKYIALGATGAIMYHRNFEKENSLRILPVVLPFAEIGKNHVRVRIYYVPPVRRRTDEQIAIQLLLPIWK